MRAVTMSDLCCGKLCHRVIGDSRLQRQDGDAFAITPVDPDLQLPSEALGRIQLGDVYI